MNNEQFRRLVLDNPFIDKKKARVDGDDAGEKGRGGAGASTSPTSSSGLGVALGGALGSRMRSSIPMTPYVLSLYSFLLGYSIFNI